MERKRIEEITGYPLDEFQQQSLEIIITGNDLLVSCPTSSGKTTVALTGIILKAFDRGKRAVLITPIKALGNQMFLNFQTFLTKIGFPNRVTLLTGDIQSRCCPLGGDDSPELLIMTSEILANKLDKLNRGDSSIDQDLVNVSLLVVDETHYINDPERGNVWERIFVYLPATIQIIALSATLSNPEKFCEWLSKRRPTQLVQRFDRHVPLHIGGYDSTGNFTELYSTKNPQKSFESSVFKRLVTNGNVLKLVGLLIKRDQLPAIVFCLSKQRCIDMAESVKDNLLYGKLITPDPDMDPDTAAYIEEERQHTVKTIRAQQEDFFQRYMGPYRKLLDTLPGWYEFKSLLDRGIAYHHSGLIPIFREYVEILFKAKLIKIVFATETLGVGLDMPARTVVFTQLEKPTKNDGSVLLSSDVFMQMAGRAGRRGNDTKGYVVYYPIRFNHTEGELRQVMFGTIPSATSHLSITPLFVLKNLSSTITILQRTLLFHEIEQYKQAIERRLAELPVSPHAEAIRTHLQKKTQRLSQSQRKALDKERASYDERDIELVQTRDRLKADLERYTEQLTDDWQTSLDFLVKHGFVTVDNLVYSLTIRGRVTSGLSDGEPLVRGRMIADGCLKDASFEEIVGWLGCFTDPIRPNVVSDTHDYTALMNLMFETYGKEEHAITELPYDTGILVYLWASHKDLREICTFIDMTQLGVFIRSIMRVMSYLEELKTVLLGLEMYEIYNRLDNYQERLMDGIVTNRSLYVS